MDAATPHEQPEASFARLAQAVNEVDARALLLDATTLHRLIAAWCGGRVAAVSVPHRKALIAPVTWLNRHTQPQTLGLSAWPEVNFMLLIEAPDSSRLQHQAMPALWLRTWRLLFHASIHAYLESRVDVGALTQATARARVHEIGRSTFDEACAVLAQEHLLLPPYDDTHAYIELAATYLELKYFAPHVLPRYFPTTGRARLDTALAKDISALAMLWETRLPGLPTPGDALALAVQAPILSDEDPSPQPLNNDKKTSQKEPNDALKVAAKGNLTRAIFLHVRHNDTQGAQALLATFCQQLTQHLGADLERWRRALSPLLTTARAHLLIGFTSPETRLLFDLQSACIDSARPPVQLDTWRWLWSLGQVPLRRPQPLRQRVRVGARLLRAVALSSKLHTLSAPDHLRLSALLNDISTQYQRANRALIAPALTESLHSVGLQPTCLVEQVAQRTLAEEILDSIEIKGFFTFSELRDAIARSAYKLPNASTARGWWSDPLIAANKKLSQSLDGIYRGAEVYLRWLQRLSAAAFGTRSGRALTLWIALPLLGSLVLLEGLQHSVGILLIKAFGIKAHFNQLSTLIPLAALLFGVINSSKFRAAAWRTVRATGKGIKTVCRDWPASLLQWPPLRAFLRTSLWRGIKATLVWPAVIAIPQLYVLTFNPLWARWLLAWGIGGITSAALYSATGQRIYLSCTEWFAQQWRYTTHRLLPGIFQWLLDLFKSLTTRIDLTLYQVDEWLRFREGDAPWQAPIKASLGAVWAIVAYVMRLYVNLLIEPQVNPIKHFPVVTVSHKIMLPFTVDLTRLFATGLQPILGVIIGGALSGVTVVLLPGVFGFLVWELKENWRLYEQNRPQNLQPARVGSHGEDMARLLRVGFHSGTIPKLYSALRRAERKRSTSHAAAAQLLRHQQALNHLSLDIQRFASRDLLTLLCEHPLWPLPHLVPIHVEISPCRITLWIDTPSPSTNAEQLHQPVTDAPLIQSDPLIISIREQHGWLVSEVESAGWASTLSSQARDLLLYALAGFYQRAGVCLSREHFIRAIPTGCLDHHITKEALILWFDDSYQNEQRFSFIHPSKDTPSLSSLRLDLHPIPWSSWVKFWSEDKRVDSPVYNADVLP
jgi:hypothetical protein